MALLRWIIFLYEIKICMSVNIVEKLGTNVMIRKKVFYYKAHLVDVCSIILYQRWVSRKKWFYEMLSRFSMGILIYAQLTYEEILDLHTL